jgi:hypothetical protein
MSDVYTLATALFSAIATGLAAVATWYSPRAAAQLAETMRRDSERSQERQRRRHQIFETLMQERSAIYSDASVRALNSIDVVFHDSRAVREAYSELYLAFSLNPLPQHVLEERLRRLLYVMGSDIGLGDSLKTDDFGRVYIPKPIAEERLIRDKQREQLIATLTNKPPGGSSAEVPKATGMWPPAPV